jgi:hypothetical protein
MKEHKLNLEYDFIQGYYLSDLSICDDLIKLHTNSQTVDGVCGRGVDKKTKDSKDLQLRPQEIKFYIELKSYFDELENIIEIYKTKYKYCSYDLCGWQIDDNFNIQKYSPTQGYHAWHCEKSNLGTARRHLVFMTYLNDVKEGGETEWFYQKLKVKPEKGLTIIFPTDWTFTHKGYTTIDEDKYIITGWYHFLK